MYDVYVSNLRHIGILPVMENSSNWNRLFSGIEPFEILNILSLWTAVD